MSDKRISWAGARWCAPAALLLCAACKSPFHTALDDYGPRPPIERLREIKAFPRDEFRAPEQRTTPGRDPASDLFAGVERVPVTLEEARAWTLTNNLDLRVALVDPVIANQAVSEEEGRFEWVLFNNTRYATLDQPSASSLVGSSVKNFDMDTGVRIPLRTGGEIDVSFPMSRNETNNQFTFLNPSYSGDMQISISQPLLRGGWRRANTHGIRIAAINQQISEARTKLEVIRQLAAVERSYWRLYATGKALEVAQRQYELAVEQLERARRQVDAGQSPEVEITRAEAGVSDQLEAIIIAANEVRTRQRELKQIMNVPGLDVDTKTLIIPATEPDPVQYEFDTATLTERAINDRMEILELELQLAADESTIDFQRNAALPLFTVDYTYRVNGLGASWSDSYDQVADGSFEDHVLGLQAEIPLGNITARSRVQRAILQRLQRLSTREARELAIRQEVLNAVDNLEADWWRIIASRQSAILNARTLAAEQRQFEVGARTSTDVLDASTRLADAQLAEIRALAEHQISLVDLAFATGTLLGASRIDWAPYDPRPDGDPIPPAPWGAYPPETRPEPGEIGEAGDDNADDAAQPADAQASARGG